MIRNTGLKETLLNAVNPQCKIRISKHFTIAVLHFCLHKGKIKGIISETNLQDIFFHNGFEIYFFGVSVTRYFTLYFDKTTYLRFLLLRR